MGELKVLIIDDDPGLRRTLSDILKTKGFETTTAANGADGIAAFGQGFINIVIIDIGLPDMPGTSVLEKIKTFSPTTEAIILTGNATLGSAIEATNSGAFSYLLKPYDVDELLLHISRAACKQELGERIIKQSVELHRVNSELKALYEVSASLASTLDLETLLSEVLRKITDIGMFSVNRGGCIFLENTEGLRLAAHIGISEDNVSSCSHLGPNQCLCGLSAATGGIIVSKNSCLDERHTIRYEEMSCHGHIVVPLISAGKSVGVLCLYVAPDLDFDEKILQLFSTLGGIAVKAIFTYPLSATIGYQL